MHHRLFVTFDKYHVDTSEEARRYVYETLLNEGFCSESGRFSPSFADWFVIGGRFSGILSRCSWAKRIHAEIEAAEHKTQIQIWGCHYADPTMQKLQQQFAAMAQKLWNTAAPDDYKGIPYQRDTYRDYGYEDDAMLITSELYDELLKDYAGSTENEEHVNLDDTAVSPSLIGTAWLVVVDYHT